MEKFQVGDNVSLDSDLIGHKERFIMDLVDHGLAYPAGSSDEVTNQPISLGEILNECTITLKRITSAVCIITISRKFNVSGKTQEFSITRSVNVNWVRSIPSETES